jgi:hypothetical protein
MKKTIIIAALGFFLLPGIRQASAQVALVRKPVVEILEYFAMKGGTQGLKELEEAGGEKAVLEIVERATKQGGDELAQQVVTLTRKHGVRALEAVGADPALMVKALKSVPEDRLVSVVAESARHPDLMAKLVRTHGDEVLLASARHPGVGVQVIEEFGAGGLNAAKSLSTDKMLMLGRTKGFGQLPEASKNTLLGLLNRSPLEVVNALAIIGGGTAIVLTADKVDQIGDIVIGTANKPGRIIAVGETYSWVLGGCLVAVLLGYAGIKLWGVWQVTRRKVGKH